MSVIQKPGLELKASSNLPLCTSNCLVDEVQRWTYQSLDNFQSSGTVANGRLAKYA